VPDAAVDHAIDRAFGALAGLVRIERSGTGDWVLHASVVDGRVAGFFETRDGKRGGEPIEAPAAIFAENARDEFMALWRDAVRRDRAHRLAGNAAAAEKLLAYYDLMGAASRLEFVDRGRLVLDEALAADPRYVPALAERSRLWRMAANRPGDDPAEDLRLARADADEALRLSPR